jgi:hypothetical protein
MGQKTNPTILRLGNIKEWNIKYIEKKSTELPLKSFISLEIEKFIHKFFKTNNLRVQNCKILFSETSLQIFIAYFSKPEICTSIKTINEKQKIKIKFKNSQLQNQKNKQILLKKHRNFILYDKKACIGYVFNKVTQNHDQSRHQRLATLNSYKKYILAKKYKNFQHQKTNIFFKKLIKSIDCFTNKKLNFFITLEQLNNNINLIEFLNYKKKKN